MKTKLNLGCGADYRPGWINVDHPRAVTRKDVAHDLDKCPWPFADGSADEIYMGSTLEHLTFPDEKVREVWRLLKPGGVFYGTVPYGRADGAMYVMEHRQFFTEKSFDMFCADASGKTRCEYLFPEPLFKMERVRLKRESNTWRTRLRCLIPFPSVLTYFISNLYDDVEFRLTKLPAVKGQSPSSLTPSSTNPLIHHCNV